MIKSRLIYIFFLFILFAMKSSCKKEIKQEIIEKKPLIIEEKTAVEPLIQPKSFDSINHNNAIDFLIAYGKLHKEHKVRIKTRLGNLIVQLYNDTPLHRANFIFLTEVGYFNTTCFHRVAPNFIVQGGNSESYETLEIRNKYQNYTIPAEFRKHRKHKYGALAAARDWEKNISKKSTPFEFYIIQAKQGAHHINGEHTVFGELIDGFDVLEKISKVATGRDEWPLEDVYMEVEVVE